ncbi:MAG TPA: 16S rRNA (adenine(1518)-N(6)/adenine(1519)-N(6))-dimethyltransferase RsmA [archaeon]|nr:16S rRNA (adenine(1518)-N(6)/adenine(1519)-N(6))-dimethyltransferase RsmA [archaeon]
MSLFSELSQLMIEYRFRPEQGFSQNFIIDEVILQKMVDTAELEENDIVLEIGCGTGFLTKQLLEKCKVVGFEKDPKMVQILKGKFSENKNFKLIEKDFLQTEIPKFTKVVSLPPYNISTEIVLRLLLSSPKKIVLIFQREFSEKIIAEPGFWDYSYISALCRVKFEPQVIVQNISPMAFYPKPQAYSTLLVLNPREQEVKIKDFSAFALFVKNLFRYKNKNLANALLLCEKQLSGKIKFSKKGVKEVLEDEISKEKVNLIWPDELAQIFRKLSQ